MTNNQLTLRTAAKFLRCVAEGAPATAGEFKTMSDLCWLCLPGKYRLSREEIAEIKSKPWSKYGAVLKKEGLEQ